MLYMNGYEIDLALRRYAVHPVLGKAVRFLADFRDEVNSHSDGWSSWRLPVSAAAKLMTLVQAGPEVATEAVYKKALSPIRAFYTRRGNAAGMTFPREVDAVRTPEGIEFVVHDWKCPVCGHKQDEHINPESGPFVTVICGECTGTFTDEQLDAESLARFQAARTAAEMYAIRNRR